MVPLLFGGPLSFSSGECGCKETKKKREHKKNTGLSDDNSVFFYDNSVPLSSRSPKRKPLYDMEVTGLCKHFVEFFHRYALMLQRNLSLQCGSQLGLYGTVYQPFDALFLL